MLNQMLAPLAPRTKECPRRMGHLQNETYYQDRIECLLEMFPESDRVIAPSISKHAKVAHCN